MIDLIFKDCNDNINYLRGQICIFSGALFDCVSEKNQEIEFLIEETFTIVYISQSSKSQKTFFKAQLEVNGVIRSLMEFGTTGIFNFTLKADLMSIEKVNNSPNYAYFLVKDYELQMGFIGVSIEQCGYFGIYDNDDCKFESWRHFPQFLIFTVTNKDEIIYFYNSNKNGNIVKLVGTTDVTVQTLVEGVGENVILVRFGISLGFETSQCMNLLPEMDLWLQLDGNMFWLRNKQQVTCRFDEMCVALDTSFSDSC
ncbi:hypothetical protein SS50377_24542 [Spironucleus salmonicida]|uniref:Uncharacterized protein n=1 Tax=Spironucleus salmonicida TaxID=348837 RepID=V6LQD2_9EUKA|nr:hypothetical protein SS50377_24542 [Spironucleus salmonicida]|eukprot:EST45916.1 Hypothetical protein SS50377_13892 [Spironucleus salmonicida]